MKSKSLLVGLLVFVMVGVGWGQGIEKNNIPRNFTGLSAKTTLTGADIFVLNDSADANLAKKITITNLLTYLNSALSITNITGNAATATKWGPYAAISGLTQNRTIEVPDASGKVVFELGIQTLSSKRINTRVVTLPSNDATIDVAAGLTVASGDQFNVLALAQATDFAAPGGAPTDGQKIVLRIKDDGTARGLTWNAIFRAGDEALPTTTVMNKTAYYHFVYNAADTKWDYQGAKGGF